MPNDQLYVSLNEFQRTWRFVTYKEPVFNDGSITGFMRYRLQKMS